MPSALKPRAASSSSDLARSRSPEPEGEHGRNGTDRHGHGEADRLPAVVDRRGRLSRPEPPAGHHRSGGDQEDPGREQRQRSGERVGEELREDRGHRRQCTDRADGQQHQVVPHRRDRDDRDDRGQRQHRSPPPVHRELTADHGDGRAERRRRLPAPEHLAPAEHQPDCSDAPHRHTTRAAYLLVRNEVVAQYPAIRFVLSHAGGFLPYAADRMALVIARDTGLDRTVVRNQFRNFYFDTALSTGAATLPALLAFAEPGHTVFGSDWPFTPQAAVDQFTDGLDHYPGVDEAVRQAIDRDNAVALFSR